MRFKSSKRHFFSSSEAMEWKLRALRLQNIKLQSQLRPFTRQPSEKRHSLTFSASPVATRATRNNNHRFLIPTAERTPLLSSKLIGKKSEKVQLKTKFFVSSLSVSLVGQSVLLLSLGSTASVQAAAKCELNCRWKFLLENLFGLARLAWPVTSLRSGKGRGGRRRFQLLS